ncbi:MAG TPA: hypothetical protein VGJ95_09805 [Pseudonocardiaceae bacterium]|jgi:NAD(P)H-dependent FMN reductase
MAAEVRLDVVEDGSDDEHLEELALSLRRELLALDVDSVEPAPTGEPAPEGTRSGLIAAAGALVVALPPTLEAITAVVTLVRDWLRRAGPRHTVRVEIGGDVLELTGATSEQQARLVENWLARHAAK